MIEPIAFWVCWYLAGLLGTGIQNGYMRLKFKSLHIEGYFPHMRGEAVYNSDSHEFIMIYIAALFGPLSLIVSLLWALVDGFRHFYFTLRTTPWTQEEAKKLFPNSYNYDLDIRLKC